MWWFLILLPFSSAIFCDLCKYGAGNFQNGLLESQNLRNFGEEVAVLICIHYVKYPEEVCRGAVHEMTPSVLTSVLGKFLDPERVCTGMKLCDSPKFVNDNITLFYDQVFNNKPEYVRVNNTSTRSLNVLHISDLHFDLDYLEGSNENCGLPVCCRNGTGNAGRWGSYSCDLPVSTLEAALQSASKHDVDMVVWTGDNVPHDIWMQSQEYQVKYIKTATDLVKKYFDVPVFPTLGNHGTYPVNVFNFGHEQWLTDALAEIWGGFVDERSKATLKEGGFYSTKHPSLNLRVISLNCAAYNSENWYLIYNITDPGNQISWLWNELAQAEKNNELVYIISHSAPGKTSLTEWALHFSALADRYSHIIRGQFFGHSHSDKFMVQKELFTPKPIGLQFIGPSITTYTEINPSYRIYQVDSESLQVTNYYQYRLNLTQANLNPNSEPEFELAYDFLSEYGVSDMYPDTILDWLNAIKDDEQQVLKLRRNQETQGPGAPTSCDEWCRKSTYCGFSNALGADEDVCAGYKPSTQDQLMSLLFGNWTYKVYK